MLCPPGPAAELLGRAGATVHTGPVAAFTHIWASTYRGRRWALLGLELARLPAHLRSLGTVLEERRFALAHLNDAPLVPAAIRLRRAGLPVVWHLRSSLPPSAGPRRSALMRTAVARLASVTIAIDEDVAASYRTDSTVIPNPVDLERFRPGTAPAERRALGIPPGVPVAGFFGFLYPAKGYCDFVEAAALLRRRGLAARFLIVGGDVRGAAFFATPLGRVVQSFDLARDHEAEARRLVRRLRLDDAVTFVPFTEDTAALYRVTDVVVAPSRGPELGRPVLEAAASGRPVVASGSSSGGGVLLPGRTGLLVPPRSPAVLAAALERLLADAELRARLGTTARAHAERHFSPERNAQRLMETYERVLRAHA